MPSPAIDRSPGKGPTVAPYLAQALNLFGALFCAAALVGGFRYCSASAGDWWIAVGYLVLALGVGTLLVYLPRRPVWFCTYLVILALTVRLVWALNAASPPQEDYGDYRSAALDALHGDWYALQHTFWPWGNILWLYLIARLCGPALHPALIANALVGTATTVLIYAVGRRLAAERAARAGGVIYALYPAAILWSSILCTEIPHLLLLLSGFLCLLLGFGVANEHADPAREALGPGARTSSFRWLIAGGLLLAGADFFRPVSLLLLVPVTLYAAAKRTTPSPARPHGAGNTRRALIPLIAYGFGIAAFLIGKSLVTGYVNLTPSYTAGMNLACGLNWRSGGLWNETDDRMIMVSDDPRVVNRKGLQLAAHRARLLVGPERRRLVPLLIGKFPLNWSSEGESYFANANALPAERRANHWLIRYGPALRVLTQVGLMAVLALAGVGFWHQRRSAALSVISAAIGLFVLCHAVFEVQDRYHFAVGGLLAVAAGSALLGRRLNTQSQPRVSR